jgi:hypothetical protein
VRKKRALTLVAVKREPEPPAPPANDLALLPDDCYAIAVGGRTFAMLGEDFDHTVAWVDGGKVKRVKVREWCHGFAVHPSGTRALFASSRVVREIVLPKTRATALIDIGGAWSINGLGYGPADTITVLTADGLTLYARDGERLVEVDRAAVFGIRLHMCREGTLAVCLAGTSKVVVFSVSPTKLAKLGVAKRPTRGRLNEIIEVGGRIYVTDYDVTFELKGA